MKLIETAFVVTQARVKVLPDRTDAGVAVSETEGAFLLTVTVAVAGDEVCPPEPCAISV